MSLRELAKRLGMSYSNLSKKERGEIGITPPERRALSNVFGMSLDEFDSVWRAARLEKHRGPGIPVINVGPCGEVIDYEEYSVDSGLGYQYLDWGEIDDEHAFAVRAIGDSMEPTIHEGDFVIFSPMNVPKPSAKLVDGAIVGVRFSALAKSQGFTVGRFFKTGEADFVIRKDNRKYRDIPATLRFDSVNPPSVDRIAVAIERRTRL